MVARMKIPCIGRTFCIACQAEAIVDLWVGGLMHRIRLFRYGQL